MKTSELTGAALDWAVAKCEGRFDVAEDADYWKEDGAWWFIQTREEKVSSEKFNTSTNWAQGGLIIEREKINVSLSTTAPWMAWFYDGVEMVWLTDGATPLVAAMRCYVASKLGDEVEIPNELTKGESK
jgi:hypothetical protein